MTDIPPTQRPASPPAEKATSLVLVNTGDGKGKSTSAFGTALRAVARGWKVCVIQFIKSGKWKVGEEAVGRDIGIEWWSIGDGFTWNSKDMDQTEATAREAWRAAKEKIESGTYDMVLLDEITYPMNWGWIETAEVVGTIRDRPPNVNIIATGRDAPAELIEIADTVTEMRKVKHAFDRGTKARRGIDL
jgi:cob(I)alamin adenosyltransferase